MRAALQTSIGLVIGPAGSSRVQCSPGYGTWGSRCLQARLLEANCASRCSTSCGGAATEDVVVGTRQTDQSQTGDLSYKVRIRFRRFAPQCQNWAYEVQFPPAAGWLATRLTDAVRKGLSGSSKTSVVGFCWRTTGWSSSRPRRQFVLRMFRPDPGFQGSKHFAATCSCLLRSHWLRAPCGR